MTSQHAWNPSWSIHPCETLNETLEERGITPAEFVTTSGIDPEYLGRFLLGMADVTPELAGQLESALGIPARLWIGLQEDYDRSKAAGS